MPELRHGVPKELGGGGINFGSSEKNLEGTFFLLHDFCTIFGATRRDSSFLEGDGPGPQAPRSEPPLLKNDASAENAYINIIFTNKAA